MNVTPMVKVIAQREGFRYVERGVIPLNGRPDLRLQVQDEYTLRWRDAYLFDNQTQFNLAIEDLEYAKWLTGQPAYRKYT
jgi:hypothetical protein